MELQRAFDDLERRPSRPMAAYTTTAAKLPPARDYPNTIIRLSDLNTLATSDGVAWRRVDTGATL